MKYLFQIVFIWLIETLVTARVAERYLLQEYEAFKCNPTDVDCDSLSMTEQQYSLQDCKDEVLPGTSDCYQILQSNSCNDIAIRGLFCQKSCGYCKDDSSRSDSIVGCGDIAPTDAQFGCDQYLELGLCDKIVEGYCRQSCGRCCEDVLIPGTEDCSIVLETETCNSPGVVGQFCLKSCGYCQAATPTSTFTPIPPDGTLTPSSYLRFLTPASNLNNGLDSRCLDSTALQCDLEALIAFKNTVTRGEQLLSSWQGDDPCIWEYIKCKKVDTINKRVIQLVLHDGSDDKDDFKLTASLVPQFSDMRYLSDFAITYQNVSGVLYEEFSVLNELVTFRVDRMEISGTLPKEYSVLSKMSQFILARNGMNGTLPPEWSEWDSLREFTASYNKLSGQLPPQFSVWTNLRVFILSINQLTDVLPVPFSAWLNLQDFYIAGNRISGTLPVQYSIFQQLQGFGVGVNLLSGSLPPEYSVWENCVDFSAQTNSITGALPKEYSTMSQMVEFWIGNNFLSGTYPVEYSIMQDMEDFFSKNNDFVGKIPNEWSTFSNTAEMSV